MDTLQTGVLAAPLTLPCGLVLPNRVLKSAMGEALADPWTSNVTAAMVRLYERWADGGTGTLVTGMMCVARGAGSNVLPVLDDRTDTGALAGLARAVHRRDTRLIGQIVHPGRQAEVYVVRHPAAPSALPPVRNSRMFGSSRALSAGEIVDLVDRFAGAAAMLERAGFDGVQLHAAHGYLIGEFLSPATNLRDDEWGGDLQRRARFLLEAVRAIRRRVGAGFAVMVKINASDFRPGGFDVDDSAHVVGMLGREGVDLIEVSGGTYESRSGALGVRADEPGTAKDAYFAGLAPRLRAMTGVPLALTGGLRSRAVMERLIGDGTVDVVGIARPLVQQPEYTGLLLSGAADSIDLAACPGRGMEELFWWMMQFRRLAAGEDFDPGLSLRRVRLEAPLVLGRQVASTARRKALDLVPLRR